MNTIDFTGDQFNEIKVAADWIRDLEASDSRLHKEAVIEKALMASKLGSANAQCFLFNCYQAYNPYYVFGVKKVPETVGLEHQPISGILMVHHHSQFQAQLVQASSRRIILPLELIPITPQ
jgi:hypothetical protein